MAGFRYSPEVKSKILRVVRDARTGAKSWDETLLLAKEAGYNGNVAGIQNFIRNAVNSEAKNNVAEKAAAPAKKRGRPKKEGPVLATAPATVAQVGSGMDAVQQVIDNIVKQRIAAAFAKVKAAIEEAERTA